MEVRHAETNYMNGLDCEIGPIPIFHHMQDRMRDYHIRGS